MSGVLLGARGTGMRLNKRRGHGATSNTTSPGRCPQAPVKASTQPPSQQPERSERSAPGPPGPGHWQAPTTQDPRIGQVALCYRSEGALLLSLKSLNPGAVKWRGC